MATQVKTSVLPPEVTSGSIQPLLRGKTSRPLRYSPEHGGFVIRNGKEYFNRPLYSSGPFRVDAGDLPEFSLYLPGHGGNLKLGIMRGGDSKWTSDADSILARYERGRMKYEIRDRLLGQGVLYIEVQTAFDAASLLVRITPSDIHDDVRFTWAFGGASGRKGKRGGDIGCESQPVSELFQVKQQDCAKNRFSLQATSALLQSPAGNFRLLFPEGATLALAPYDYWLRPPLTVETSTVEPENPILTGSLPLHDATHYIEIHQDAPATSEAALSPEASFSKAAILLETASSRLAVSTPDEYINTAAVALCSAETGIWDEKQGCVMHGAVAWRSPLAGWRGPYVLDVLGEHEKAQRHFRHWFARQNTAPVTTAIPATGPFDPDKGLSRKESLLHSNGDLSHNHYDMNLVFFDVLLRHLRWTGDLEFAKEAWPAYQRHLDWERRLFRREFQANGKSLPLYEAYAAIWASDNLQYSGGGAAHSTSYNAFSFHRAAEIASAIGEDPTPFAQEAQSIDEAIQQILWVPHRGELAEAKDLMDPQTLYDNAALWTLYHAIDSEVLSKRQGWQMIENRLREYRKVPIDGLNVPAGDWYLLSCSNWMPYMWSLNLLLMAENSHLALAMWQVGMKEEAFRIFKGNLLDSMYQGLCAGNFHMTSQLDPHRQEAQRDFGDPIGITARALLEGLYGIRPDMLNNRVMWVPGFPDSWNRASMTQRDFSLAWQREGHTEHYSLTCNFRRPVTVQFLIPARSTQLPEISAHGTKIPCTFDEAAVGQPWLSFEVPQYLANDIQVMWRGNPAPGSPAHRVYSSEDMLELPAGVTLQQLDDPQQSLRGGRFQTEGTHTVFARIKQHQAVWLMPIAFTVKHPDPPQTFPLPKHDATFDCIDLSPIMTEDLTTIFTRGYKSPRSQYCSLAIPDSLLGGWADIGEPLAIDDRGLRSGPALLVADTLPFRMSISGEPNCLFLSRFQPDAHIQQVPLSGHASHIFILVTGTTLPQCSHLVHATMTVHYVDGSTKSLAMRNPETWWPIEQDYLVDDYLFQYEGVFPPRVDLATGKTRLPTGGGGGKISGGSATLLHLELDNSKTLKYVEFRTELYGIVLALLAITLEQRTAPPAGATTSSAPSLR